MCEILGSHTISDQSLLLSTTIPNDIGVCVCVYRCKVLFSLSSYVPDM